MGRLSVAVPRSDPQSLEEKSPPDPPAGRSPQPGGSGGRDQAPRADRPREARLQPPIFAVSAKLAFQAKTGDPALRDDLFAKSHFNELEHHISDTIAGGESGAGKLRSVCQSAQVIVRELAEKAKGAFATISRDNDRIQQLGGSLDERKEQSLRQVGGVLWSLAQNFERTQKKSEELLSERLSWGRTFQLIFRKQKWHTDFQESIDSQLRDTLKRQIANSIELLEVDLKAVWQQLHENIQRTFATEVPAPPAPPISSTSATSCSRRSSSPSSSACPAAPSRIR